MMFKRIRLLQKSCNLWQPGIDIISTPAYASVKQFFKAKRQYYKDENKRKPATCNRQTTRSELWVEAYAGIMARLVSKWRSDGAFSFSHTFFSKDHMRKQSVLRYQNTGSDCVRLFLISLK